jgi:ubiquinol-cytochrome c reductase cytochrome b/c1 subunit
MAALRSIIAVACWLIALLAPTCAQEHTQEATIEKNRWSFTGPFGKYDRAQLQRGLHVYREVCATCHGLSMIAFRNLADPGGPGFTPEQAEAIAAEYRIQAGPNDQGEMFERPGRLADHFPSPFPNEEAARARYGAVPPDMSVIAKARGYERGFPYWVLDMLLQYQEHGVDYISALMQGYQENPPAGVTLPPGSYYNRIFPAHIIRMPPPLRTDGQVEYTDGTPATIEQYAKDVSAFLMWAAEPHLMQRKRVGLQVFIFLIVLAGLLYFTKKKVWHAVELHPEALKPRAPVEYPPP